jgi:hypothetical protein
MQRLIGVAAAIAIVATFAACSDDDDNGVKATLGEFVVELDPPTASAGDVSIDIENGGGETHELVVVRADSAADLPTDDDGAVDEDAVDEADAIGEQEDIAAGDDASLSFDLEVGRYVLFCNIVEEEDGETVSHFAEGMHAVLTVSS